MSQNDFVIANQTAPTFRADLNTALQALASNSSGATAPSSTYANMLWYDTATNILKMRSEADDAWISLGTLDQGTNTFAAANAAPLASPSFTGIPSAPTATLGTNTTQLATTAFVLANSVMSSVWDTATEVPLVGTDPSTLTITGLSGNKQVRGFAIAGNTQAGTVQLSARSTGGTWRTFGVQSVSFGDSFVIAFHIENFNNASTNEYAGFKRISFAGSEFGFTNPTISNVIYSGLSETKTILLYDEVWDEIQIGFSAGTFDSSDNELIVIQGSTVAA